MRDVVELMQVPIGAKQFEILAQATAVQNKEAMNECDKTRAEVSVVVHVAICACLVRTRTVTKPSCKLQIRARARALKCIRVVRFHTDDETGNLTLQHDSTSETR